MTRGNPTPNIGPTPPAPAAFAQIAGTPADQDVPVWSAAEGYASWGSAGGLTVTTFTLTAPQIKAASTPRALVPAQGANKVIIPIGGIVVMVYGGVAFPADTSLFGLPGVGVQQSNFWSQTADQTLHLGGPEGETPLAQMENVAYTLTTAFPGSVVSATVSGGNGGADYAVNDTGTLTGAGDENATYKVTAVDGSGAITTLTITAGGTNYTKSVSCVATPGGSQPGIGSGAFPTVAAVDASGAPGNGTAYGQVIYAVQTILLG